MNLILDMDQTLISGEIYKNKPNAISVRPYLKLFLKHAFEQFANVSLWTSAEKSWYDEVYNEILCKELPEGKTFDFVWTRDKCLKKQICIRSNMGMPMDVTIYVKQLDQVYSMYPAYSKHNTFIVDDNHHSYSDNIENAIPIKPFHHLDEFCEEDDKLVKLSQYFRSLEFNENICMLKESMLSDEIELDNIHISIIKALNPNNIPLTPLDNDIEHQL